MLGPVSRRLAEVPMPVTSSRNIGLPPLGLGSACRKCSAQRLLSGPVFRDGSHSFPFRPPSLLATQIAPTVAVQNPQGSRGVYIRAERMSLPSYASDMLVVRTGQLTTGDFHPIRLPALSAAPPRCLGRPLSACRGPRPRRVRIAPRPSHGAVAVAFRDYDPLGTRHILRFEADTHGPHARVPTLHRPRHHERRKAHYRLGRAHPWPGGICTRWTTNEVSWGHRILPFLFDQPCLVAP